MSGAAILTNLLTGAATLTPIVAAAQIFPGRVPVKTPAPALGIAEISGTEMLTVSMLGAKKLRTQRVQVTIHAVSYSQQKRILELVRAICKNQRGPVATFDLDSILPGGEGPDGGDEAAGLYEQTVDFLVRWRSA